MTREEAHSEVPNLDYRRWGVVHDIIDEIFDHFEQKEAELRAEFQKKISEINLEHDSRVCENCYHNEYCSILQTAFDFDYDVKNLADFGCTNFKRKQ